MADNYLERKMEEHRAPSAKKIITNPSLDSLLVKNRSYRKFAAGVPSEALQRIVSVVTKLSSAKNRQVLRYVIVEGEKAARIEASRGFGKSFIVVCSTLPEMDNYAWIDLGIAAQTILLKATELGYNGIMCANFDKELVCELMENRCDTVTGAALKPVLLIALGVKDLKVQLLNLQPGTPVECDTLKPYDKDGIHYVPKIHIGDLVVKA